MLKYRHKLLYVSSLTNQSYEGVDMIMKIQQLEYFIAVVKYNSFTQAAKMIHISQPSLTATIKRMENDLGYELFIRTTKAIKITEKGIQFYHHAVKLVEEYHQTMEKMYDLNVSQSPKIKISILESMSRWVPIVIQKHNQQHPGQHYQILEILDHARIVNSLLNFDIHIGLTNEHVKHEDIDSVALYEEDYVLITPSDDFSDQESISIKDLPLILPNKEYQVRRHLDDYFQLMSVRPTIVLEVDRFEAATNFVHQHMGYAVIPRMYYQSFNTDGLNVIKIEPAIKRTIYMNTLKKRKHSEEVLSLMDSCKDYWNIGQ